MDDPAIECELRDRPRIERNARVIRRYCDAWRRGDVDALHNSYHSDFILHYPGHHFLAGDHRGKEKALRVLSEVAQRVKRTLVEITDAMAGVSRSVILVRERIEHNDATEELSRVFVYSIRDDLLHECWLYDYEPDRFARFLSREAQ